MPRRSLGIFAVVLCAVAALSAGSAAGRDKGCTAGAEAAGCKLPDGARFYAKTSSSGSLTVQVGPKGVSLTAYAVTIRCTKFAPLLGSQQQLALGLSGKQVPKVGKSYILKETETQRGEEGEGTSTSTTEAKLEFKSAKLVVVKIDFLSETDGEIGCDGGGSWNVKRQS